MSCIISGSLTFGFQGRELWNSLYRLRKLPIECLRASVQANHVLSALLLVLLSITLHKHVFSLPCPSAAPSPCLWRLHRSPYLQHLIHCEKVSVNRTQQLWYMYFFIWYFVLGFKYSLVDYMLVNLQLFDTNTIQWTWNIDGRSNPVDVFCCTSTVGATARLFEGK